MAAAFKIHTPKMNSKSYTGEWMNFKSFTHWATIFKNLYTFMQNWSLYKSEHSNYKLQYSSIKHGCGDFVCRFLMNKSIETRSPSNRLFQNLTEGLWALNTAVKWSQTGASFVTIFLKFRSLSGFSVRCMQFWWHPFSLLFDFKFPLPTTLTYKCISFDDRFC